MVDTVLENFDVESMVYWSNILTIIAWSKSTPYSFKIKKRLTKFTKISVLLLCSLSSFKDQWHLHSSKLCIHFFSILETSRSTWSNKHILYTITEYGEVFILAWHMVISFEKMLHYYQNWFFSVLLAKKLYSKIILIFVSIAVGDGKFLGMQDFNFYPNSTKFYPIYPNLPNFFRKIAQILLKFA